MLQRVARAAGSVAARCIASDLHPVTRAAACGCSSSYSDSHSWQHRGQRSYAEIAEEPVEVRLPGAGNERVQKLVEEIVNLNLLEVADLTELLRQRLGLGAMAGMMPQMGAPQQAAPAQVEEAPAAKEEQTEFDIVLDGFGASDKIKVIKEVRAVLPELGLKDAKVLVSTRGQTLHVMSRNAVPALTRPSEGSIAIWVCNCDLGVQL